MAVLVIDCPHCPATNSSFVVKWSSHIPSKNQSFSYSAATCGACSRPVCFMAQNKNGTSHIPTAYEGLIEDNFIISTVWPVRSATLAPLHLPPLVKIRYLEAEDSFERAKWNSAVAMYRSTLDIATKGMDGVPEGTFFKRLVWLAENHVITPDIRSWADHVRVEGNAALHEPEQFGGQDAKALRFFTEMFLRYVFELPGEVKKFRAEPESVTPPTAKT